MTEIRRFREMMPRPLEMVAENHFISIKNIELRITTQEFRFLRKRCGVQGAQNDIPGVCTLAPSVAHLAFLCKASSNLTVFIALE
jgi:hypothetical protein